MILVICVIVRWNSPKTNLFTDNRGRVEILSLKVENLTILSTRPLKKLSSEDKFCLVYNAIIFTPAGPTFLHWMNVAIPDTKRDIETR